MAIQSMAQSNQKMQVKRKDAKPLEPTTFMF